MYSCITCDSSHLYYSCQILLCVCVKLSRELVQPATSTLLISKYFCIKVAFISEGMLGMICHNLATLCPVYKGTQCPIFEWESWQAGYKTALHIQPNCLLWDQYAAVYHCMVVCNSHSMAFNTIVQHYDYVVKYASQFSALHSKYLPHYCSLLSHRASAGSWHQLATTYNGFSFRWNVTFLSFLYLWRSVLFQSSKGKVTKTSRTCTCCT